MGLIGIGPGTISCKGGDGESSPASSYEASCPDGDSGRGEWTTLRQPDEVIGNAGLSARHSLSDGSTFSILRADGVGRLSAQSNDWETFLTNRQISLTGHVAAASPDFLMVQGGESTVDASRPTVTTVDVLDLSARTWASYAPPDEIVLSNRPTIAAWTGDSLLLWGGYVSLSPAEAALDFRAVLFSPTTGDWRTILGPREPFRYIVEDLPRSIDGHLSASWGEGRLFVWGILPDASETFGYHLDVSSGEWNELPQNGPGPRRHHRVIAAGDEMFLVGGIRVESDSDWKHLGEIWRYSKTTGDWQQLEVPEFVDPREAVWMNDALYVFGVCDSDAVYEPASDSWHALSSLPIPDVGVPYAAGGRIYLMDVTEPHGDNLLDVFIFDPVAPGEGGAGGD